MEGDRLAPKGTLSQSVVNAVPNASFVKDECSRAMVRLQTPKGIPRIGSTAASIQLNGMVSLVLRAESTV